MMNKSITFSLPDFTHADVVEQAKRLKITDEQTFVEGAELLLKLHDGKKEIKSQTDNIIKQAFSLHKQLKAEQVAALKPLEEAEELLKNELGQYNQTYGCKGVADGLSFMTVYDVHVEDKAKLVAYVAENPEFLNFLSVDVVAIKQYAKATDCAMQIAGVVIEKIEKAKPTGR